MCRYAQNEPEQMVHRSLRTAIFRRIIDSLKAVWPISYDVFTRSFSTRFGPACFLIRLMVGAVFLSEGIQKLLFPSELGAGRFAKIGIPMPEVLGPFVGIVEIVCGTMILIGLFTRIAAIALIIDMLVAIATTKVPILVSKGFWAMAHEGRTDYAMLLGSIFLLIAGAGPWSIDARLGQDQR
jgi:putative oxidoreductase